VGDTFTRADGATPADSLGATEIGGFPWYERNNTGGTEHVASISGNELYLYVGNALAVAEVNQADLALSADVRFNNTGSGTIATKAAGINLRQSDKDTYFYGSANRGSVSVQMLPNGAFFVGEQVSGSAFTQLFKGNVFAPGTTYQEFQPPGTLPKTINGQPFDSNEDGILDSTESFRLGAIASGNTYQVQINGKTVAAFPLTGTSGISGNGLSLLRNNWGGSGIDSYPYWDNLVGEAPAPLPVAMDTFTRADSTNLGTSELGGQAWIERSMGGSGSTAPTISGYRLYIPPLNSVQAILDVNLPDIEATADVTFALASGSGTAGQCAGFTLRKPELFSAVGNANSSGQIAIQMLPTGALGVYEQVGSSYVQLYQENPWSGASGYPGIINFPGPGVLPQTINGLPFDWNQDGRLDGSEETFELSAYLFDQDLSVRINGEAILRFTVAGDGNPGNNYFSVLENNWGGTLPTGVYYDNVSLGVAVPEPTTVMLLGIGALGLIGFRLRRKPTA